MKPLKLEELSTLSSQLITNDSEKKFVLKSLNFPSDINLVYRASDHFLKVATFHQKCDNLSNTLTIIKTEHGKLIGGFTPLKWNDRNGRDKSNKTFLMAIHLQEKISHLRNGECAIHFDQDLGPSFGGMF